MIVPWLKGFLSWERAPLTWALIFLNVFIFAITNSSAKKAKVPYFEETRALVLTGKLYWQAQNQGTLPDKNTTEWVLLGAQGLRDPQFVREGHKQPFLGDQVEIQAWREQLIRFHDVMERRSMSVFGLIHGDKGFKASFAWVTYQFMHAGIIHLLGNMLMLLLFGGAIEVMTNGFVVIFLYLLSGLAGGLGFFLLSPISLAPVVGASGAVSGIMAFYAIAEQKKRVSFFYFISPIREHYGWIYLPTYLIWPLCFVSDVVGYFATSKELGTGVAYTAHIGGALFGILAAYLYRSRLLEFFFARSKASTQ